MQINRVKDTVGNVEDITELLSLNLTHQFLFFYFQSLFIFISYHYVDLDTEGGRSLDPWLFMVINFPSGQGPHVQLPTALLGQLRKWKLRIKPNGYRCYTRRAIWGKDGILKRRIAFCITTDSGNKGTNQFMMVSWSHRDKPFILVQFVGDQTVASL